MRPILLLLPYIFTPLLITLLFKWLGFSWKWLTFVLSGSLIFIYPFGMFWLDDYLNPPAPGWRCGNPQMGFFLGNIIIGLPISLVMQYIFNKLLLKGRGNPNGLPDTGI